MGEGGSWNYTPRISKLTTIISVLYLYDRLDSRNTGAEEHNIYCLDCVPLAIAAAEVAEEGGTPDSAKIRMILRLLREIDERSNGEEKTIIFSQFTSMLDLIQPFLDKNGIKYVRCAFFLSLLSRFLVVLRIDFETFSVDDGSMSRADREYTLSKIKKSKSTRVVLISFKAGSTGALLS